MRLSTIQRRLLGLGAWGMAVGVSAAAAMAQSTGQETFGRTSWWLPQNVSSYGHSIDNLFNFILYMTCGVGLGVFLVLIVFLIKYRHRPDRHALFTHGNTKLEIVWTLVPTFLMALTAALGASTWSYIKNPSTMPKGEDVVHIEIVGKQFKWYIHYPGKDGKMGQRKAELINLNAEQGDQIIGLDRSAPEAKDDIVTTSIMYIPVNRPIVIDLTSVDVIHSFFVPNMRVKQDAVPGLKGKVWFMSTRTSAQIVGNEADGSPKPFDILCAELCGPSHYTMRGQLFVVNEEAYQKFLENEAKFLGGDSFGNF